jgi:hypothetical protein
MRAALFNRSRFKSFGTIDDYRCNQDELAVAIRFLLNALEQAHDLLRFLAPRPHF